MNFSITAPTPEQFEHIKTLIGIFELDNRELHPSQFLVALNGKELLGFGRIREYENCSELCSLGVVEPERNKGIGRALVKELIKKARQPLYLVCIIPEYFASLGFNIVHSYPAPLEEKLKYCTSELIVPEAYVVMKHV